ncbi:MAG: type II secretion system protein J, partial [Pseudobdellovibrionaceae bacterium]
MNKKRPLKIFGNNRGISLIEVMITVLILGVIGAAMSSMLTSMSKENRGLSEKLASLDLVSQVSLILARNSLCNSMLA